MPPFTRSITMKFQEPYDPLTVGFLRPQTVMFDPEHLPQLQEQRGLGVGNDERSLCREPFSVIHS